MPFVMIETGSDTFKKKPTADGRTCSWPLKIRFGAASIGEQKDRG